MDVENMEVRPYDGEGPRKRPLNRILKVGAVLRGTNVFIEGQNHEVCGL